jgi:5-methylthioribose kinase
MELRYSALTLDTLSQRLSEIDSITKRVGPNHADWSVSEIGDGNLNLVFIVKGSIGTVIVKQALPYVRLVGDSWPLTLERAYFEYNALIRQEKRDPGIVPSIYYFDRAQGLIAMEYLDGFKILRGKLILGEHVSGLADTMGKFCARLAFRGSDLSLAAKEKKDDTSLFQNNVELMAITESLVFTDPYFNAERNHHTQGLDKIVQILRDDSKMKSNVQHMLRKFTSNAETMCHGDLHSGSIMCTEHETRVIDPEFAFYGPFGFDLGMLMSNYLMAYFSQPGHRKNKETVNSYQKWILDVIDKTVQVFRDEFKLLWRHERTGILYPQSLFEDQGHESEEAMEYILSDTWKDAVTVCGIEMHRRCLSLAHNADFEEISDISLRAKLEARNLLMGRDLILNAKSIGKRQDVLDLAEFYNRKDPF